MMIFIYVINSYDRIKIKVNILSNDHLYFYLAEAARFELAVRFHTAVFKTAAINQLLVFISTNVIVCKYSHIC